MGSAERNWGDVKHLKSMKRSHLSPDAVEKQATIFGASCMYDAALERQKAAENTTDPYKFWDEDDFDREFDMLATSNTTLIPRTAQRFIKCYLEDWEDECVRKNNDVNMAKLLQKYGGLEFDDLDNLDHHYIIDSNEMFYHRKSGWCVKAYKNGDEDYTPWTIDKDEALHECLAVFYKRNPRSNVQVVLKKDQEETIRKRLPVDASANQENAQQKSSKKRRASSPKKNKATDDTGNVEPTNNKNAMELRPCGKCGNLVSHIHKCDICGSYMHTFCGRPLGEEGHGQFIRCPTCDTTPV